MKTFDQFVEGLVEDSLPANVLSKVEQSYKKLMARISSASDDLQVEVASPLTKLMPVAKFHYNSAGSIFDFIATSIHYDQYSHKEKFEVLLKKEVPEFFKSPYSYDLGHGFNVILSEKTVGGKYRTEFLVQRVDLSEGMVNEKSDLSTHPSIQTIIKVLKTTWKRISDEVPDDITNAEAIELVLAEIPDAVYRKHIAPLSNDYDQDDIVSAIAQNVKFV